jgi:hypothetical protein
VPQVVPVRDEWNPRQRSRKAQEPRRWSNTYEALAIRGLSRPTSFEAEMATYSPAVARTRAALSNHTRWHPDDTDGLAERRRAFVTEKVTDYLQRTLAAAPPLTAEQRSRLTSLLQVAHGSPSPSQRAHAGDSERRKDFP